MTCCIHAKLRCGNFSQRNDAGDRDGVMGLSIELEFDFRIGSGFEFGVNGVRMSMCMQDQGIAL